jgi:hypothetical protein
MAHEGCGETAVATVVLGPAGTCPGERCGGHSVAGAQGARGRCFGWGHGPVLFKGGPVWLEWARLFKWARPG